MTLNVLQRKRYVSPVSIINWSEIHDENIIENCQIRMSLGCGYSFSFIPSLNNDSNNNINDNDSYDDNQDNNCTNGEMKTIILLMIMLIRRMIRIITIMRMWYAAAGWKGMLQTDTRGSIQANKQLSICWPVSVTY